MNATLFVGDVSLDLSLAMSHVPDLDEKVHCIGAEESVGGVVANTAVAFARAGGQARLLVQLGSDHASTYVREVLCQEELTLLAAESPGKLCRVVTLLEPHGEKRLLLYPGVSLYPSPDVVGSSDLTGVRHVHTACFGPAAEVLIDRARASGRAWSIDLEPASFASGINSLAKMIDGARILFVNDRAAQAIGGNAVERLFAMGAHAIVRTRGAAGAEFHSAGNVVSAPPPSGLPILDTTGAGDCLAGWLLAGLEAGLDAAVSLKRAVRAATISCGRFGAQTAYPTATELQSLYDQEEVQ
ncbi:carbohydrate kinase family protein [Pelagibacterium sp. 26DY04]|uniref:carbohydrate kinase family protein n=1 Tax=Pelagibacterium sp. 26DY04 TaxID=2967130 RepID=UPI0028163F39|nr:carbohydrate kinase family protein [Pelagibacterium sp. 26DY04]WMT85275.1 carbohydrate kinase family protein [Pelagibacterium sp. 26DY04]